MKIWWVTKSRWVDIDTGEELTKQEYSQYRLVRKQIHKHTKLEYVREKNGGFLQQKRGYIEVTNECTKIGVQRKLFE